jgi:hypothetical protein
MSVFARVKLGSHANVAMLFSSLMRPMTVINDAGSVKTADREYEEAARNLTVAGRSQRDCFSSPYPRTMPELLHILRSRRYAATTSATSTGSLKLPRDPLGSPLIAMIALTSNRALRISGQFSATPSGSEVPLARAWAQQLAVSLTCARPRTRSSLVRTTTLGRKRLARRPPPQRPKLDPCEQEVQAF